MVLQGDAIIRYDLSKHTFERAALRGMTDSMSPSFCQINSKKMFISGGSSKEGSSALKKYQSTSSSAYTYHWINHAIIKHKSMPAAKINHTLALFLNCVYSVGGA